MGGLRRWEFCSSLRMGGVSVLSGVCGLGGWVALG